MRIWRIEWVSITDWCVISVHFILWDKLITICRPRRDESLAESGIVDRAAKTCALQHTSNHCIHYHPLLLLMLLPDICITLCRYHQFHHSILSLLSIIHVRLHAFCVWVWLLIFVFIMNIIEFWSNWSSLHFWSVLQLAWDYHMEWRKLTNYRQVSCQFPIRCEWQTWGTRCEIEPGPW